MPRALIVGCGCRGRLLGNELFSRGWQVRGTSRTDAGAAEIEAAGIEAALADPDRGGTIVELVADVGVVVWLLGSARGTPEALAALHGPRLERVLEKLVDTPVRGFVYESAGTAPTALLAGGRELVERAGRTWHLPVGMLEADPAAEGWTLWAAAAVEHALGS